MAHGDAALTLGNLLETLGHQLIRPLTSGPALHQSISMPTLYDPLDTVSDIPGGILLLIGIRATSPEASAAVRRAAERGYCAVVIKEHDADTTGLVEVADACSIALAVVVDDVSWSQVSNLIIAAMRSRSHTESTPASAVSDLFVLANAVATALQGAVAIEDLDRNVLAYSNLEGQEIDDLRTDGILARQVPDLPKHTQQYRTVMLTEGTVHFPYDASDGEFPRLAAAVRAGREELGSIWVIAGDKPFGADADKTLLEATRLAAMHILQARSSINLERHVRAEWLRSLLDGSASALSTAGRFGLVEGVPSVVVAVTFQANDTEAGPPLVRQLVSVIEEHCGIFRANVSCVSIGLVVYVLLPTVRDDASPLRLAEGISAAVGTRLSHRVHAAISSPHVGSETLVNVRQQVDEVLRVLANTPGLPEIAHAQDVYAQMLISHLRLNLVDDLRWQHPGVVSLLQHDQERHTDYRLSLCAYFSAMGDVHVAADALKIHSNTLRYRLRRAETLFDLRLHNADDRLAIWLQLRLAE